MKILKLFLLTIATIASYSLTAQVAVNTSGNSAHEKAMLDVTSTDKGMLIPRMTEAQRNDINPDATATGLMIYQTDETPGFYYYNGLAWEAVATRAYVDNILSMMVSIHNGVRDIDGNHYEIVVIGNQIWMAENLATTKYNDGTDIPIVTNNSTWAALTTPGRCWYNNNQATYGNTYGALYNWYTVNTGNLCPIGWHVPTDGEWTTLTTYLGGELVAGGKLKEAGLVHWNDPNAGATNETGFTALPGGYRYLSGVFFNNGNDCILWSATEGSSNSRGRSRSLHNTNDDFTSGSVDKKSGVSVRCIRD